MAKYTKRPDGRYETKVDIGYDDNGKRKRKTLYALTIRELDTKVAELHQKLSKNIPVTDENITFGEWAKIWLKVYKPDITERTRKRYKSVLDNNFNKINNIRLQKLQMHHVQEMFTEHKGNPQLAYKILKAIISAAIDNDLIYKNVAKNINLPEYTADTRRALEDFEIDALEKAELSLKERIFVELCLYAGCRRGEALALTLSDIDFKEDTIRINKTIVFTDNNTPEIKDGTKTKNGSRVVPLLEPLKSHLQEYTNNLKSIYLFSGRNNILTTKTGYENLWEQIQTKVNTKWHEIREETKDFMHPADISFTAHYLRHTYCTNCYNSGIDVKTCQYLMGHTNIKTTLEIYTHLDKEKNNINSKDKLQSFINNGRQMVVNS